MAPTCSREHRDEAVAAAGQHEADRARPRAGQPRRRRVGPVARGGGRPRLTRSAVRACTPARPFSTRSTVAVLTPASRATSARRTWADDACGISHRRILLMRNEVRQSFLRRTRSGFSPAACAEAGLETQAAGARRGSVPPSAARGRAARPFEGRARASAGSSAARSGMRRGVRCRRHPAAVVRSRPRRRASRSRPGRRRRPGRRPGSMARRAARGGEERLRTRRHRSALARQGRLQGEQEPRGANEKGRLAAPFSCLRRAIVQRTTAICSRLSPL